VTKIGAGVVTLTGTNTYSGPTRVSAGNLVVTASAIPSNNAVSVSGGNYIMSGSNAKFHVGSMTITGVGAASVTPRSSPPNVLYTNALSIDAVAAKLDLNDNDLVVSYGTNPSVFGDVRGFVF